MASTYMHILASLIALIMEHKIGHTSRGSFGLSNVAGIGNPRQAAGY